VLVPLYVELAAGETVEGAVSRSDFDEVWDVLNSLQEQDDVLAEIIRHFGEQKGSGKGFDDSGFSDRVDFGGLRLSLDTLRASVATRCLDSLCSSWDVWIGKLKAFKDCFGHCNVELVADEKDALHNWVKKQRFKFFHEKLSDHKKKLLDEIGFSWESKLSDTRWMEMYLCLQRYYSEHGNTNVSAVYKKDMKLAGWVRTQRQRRKNELMPDEQIQWLDALEFAWQRRERGACAWEDRYQELIEFKKTYGHCNVPYNYPDNPQLGIWVINQRQSKKNSKLLPERERLLEEIGFNWTIVDFGGVKPTELWDLRYQELLAFKQQYGHCKVPYNYPDNKQLGVWVSTQRQKRKQNKLTQERERLLEEIGFLWSASPEYEEL